MDNVSDCDNVSDLLSDTLGEKDCDVEDDPDTEAVSEADAEAATVSEMDDVTLIVSEAE